MTLLAGPATAQEVAGAVQGSVDSAETGPEPFVRIALSGPNLQAMRTTTTDARGFFQFLALPPGIYTLHLARLGLQPLDVHGIVVQLGRTTSVPPITLALRPIAMKPVVTRTARVGIDPAGTAGGGSLDSYDYAALPVDRDYKTLISILPAANVSFLGDPINIGGSTGLENQYYIDGVNVTDTKNAGRATSLPYNFVRSIEVTSGGCDARYGRALGGIVNAVAYAGTNMFELDAFAFVQPGGLVMAPRTAPAIVEKGAINYDTGVRASGPLIRNRLWYSAAANPTVDRVEKEVAGHGYFTTRTEAVRFAAKLSWQANQATNLELSVFGDPTISDQIDPLPAGIDTVMNPDGLMHRVDSGGIVSALRATVVPAPSTLLQFSVSRQWDRYHDRGATERGLQEAAYTDYVDRSVGGGRFLQWDEDRGRLTATASGTLFLPGHALMAGLDYEDSRVFSSFASRSIVRADTFLYTRGEERYAGTFHNRAPAVFVQDRWRITEHLTLSPGVRLSRQDLVGASGRSAQRFTREWQPRLGFSWLVGSSGLQRVFGSYGRYYQTLPTNFAAIWYVDYLALYSYYSSDPRAPGAAPDSVLDGSTYEEDWASQVSGLQAEYSDEFTLGYERLLGISNKVSLRAIRRELRSSFQWGLDPTRDPIWVIGTPGKGDFAFLPPPKREYTALEIAAEGEWRELRYRASYVLSRTWGNYPGLFSSDFGYANPGGITSFFSPHQADNSTGLLPNDRPHVAKLSAVWATRFGLEAGVVASYQSGTPINDFAPGGMFGALTPTFLASRGSVGRTPALWDVNVRFQCRLPLSGSSSARLQVDFLHLGNPRRATRVDELHYLTVDEYGRPSDVNPNYQRPLAYQPPMATRVGVQWSF